MLEKIAAEGSPRPLHLIYGVTHDTDLVDMDKLADFARRIPNFTFAACVASPDSAYRTRATSPTTSRRRT